MKLIKNIIAASLTTVLLFGCKSKPIETGEDKKVFCLSDTMQKMITIDSVNMCRIDDEIELSGEVSFDENKVIKIFPRSSGQVIESKVTLGDKVSAGQVLAVIRSADVAGNYADLSSADADIAIAKRQLDNQQSLYNSGIASEREYEEAKQDYEKALASKRKIDALISINGGGSSKAGGTYTLTAPQSGYVVEKKINAGDFIRTDNNDNLFTISDMKDVWVIANVFEADIPRVKEGLQATVTTLAYPDKVFTGTIEKSSNVLDPVNKVMKVRIRLSNPDMLLKPEMFTRVTVTNETEGRAICIPSEAVVEENGKTFVVTYDGNCSLGVKEINIEKVVGNKTYLQSGVQPGQKLVAHNALLIYNHFAE